uniref:Nodule-specific cysteine-rich peptide G10 n=1 Tax=Pisum sativum TaxID=3888 RepID=A0A7T8IGF5_PEA|nr:nodule-specific cysteine-rich peptide G10 [Pisum sativum]
MVKNMFTMIKFVYIMILFFSLFLVVLNVEAANIPCDSDQDCPKNMCSVFAYKPMCYLAKCICVRRY